MTGILEVLDTGQGSQLAEGFGKHEQSTPNLYKPNRENVLEGISHAISTMGSIFKENFCSIYTEWKRRGRIKTDILALHFH